MLFRWFVGMIFFTLVLMGHLMWAFHRGGMGKGGVVLGVLMGLFVLWHASRRVARRLARPMAELSDAAREIGEGEYGGRAALERHGLREVRTLARTLNGMAAKVQRQTTDQRELLAAVSHELRSPLARMRVLLELARESGADAHSIDQLEQEVLASDRLVGEMLASSRLDFSAMDSRPLDALELAQRALERQGLSEDLLQRGEGEGKLSADPTLVSQALSNLLDNAARHGKGAIALRVEFERTSVSFAVEDAGDGFAPDTLERAFESFYRSSDGNAQGLGLGLALVKRIAEAHHGHAWAHNRPEGGAEVGFSVARG